MILSFKIKNSKSILDLTVDMGYAEKKAPNGYQDMDLWPFLEEGKIRTVPCLAIYGANASGKSNIIKAFASLNRIIKKRYIPKAFYAPNKLHPNSDITSYELEFLRDGSIFLYTLELNKEEIINEKLLIDSKCIFSIKNRVTQFVSLATEVYSSSKLETIFSVECLNQNKEFQTSFLTVLGKNYVGLNTSVATAYNFITKNLEVYPSNKLPFGYGLDKLVETSEDKDEQKAFEDMVTVLRKLDIDIKRMEYKQNEVIKSDQGHMLTPRDEYEFRVVNSKVTSTEINSYHNDIHGKEVQFNFKEESIGTQRIACLLGCVLAALRNGNILIIDELGNSLHSYLLAEVVRMFKDKRYNKKNAQLIFTTHNTDIMEQDMMRISEIGIVDKTLKKGTSFKRVSDFEGVRNVTNFRKQYLDGTFSGIPYSYI